LNYSPIFHCNISMLDKKPHHIRRLTISLLRTADTGRRHDRNALI